MDKRQAIELLEHLAWDRDIDRNPYGDAFNMAIDALKAQLFSEDTTFDLIDRQKAIDTFEKAPFGYLPDKWMSIKTLEELPPAQPEPQWIPVSERLPETGGEYLVSVRWYREDDIDIDVYDYDARCKEWNDGESCGQRVIAWMPLPEVYKPNNK